MTKKLYDKNSIESVDPREFTRMKPGVYCGDTTYSTQLAVEIFSNAVDEYRLGNGDVIEVELDLKNHRYTVTDGGQGFIPNESIREDGKTILEAAFSVLNTSGKYREDGTYEGTSLGSFGIGSKLVNFLSSSLIVSTLRDGLNEIIFFKDGLFKKREVFSVEDKSKHGTSVQWVPDPQFFTNQDVEVPALKKLFETISCLCLGLEIQLDIIDEKGIKEEIIYKSKNGLNDLVDRATKEKEIIKNRFIMNFAKNKNKMDLVMTYTSDYSSTIIPYVNTGLTDSGPHIQQIKTVLTREFNKFFREKKWLKEKDANLSGDDIQEGMYLVFNITAPNIGYDAQVKSRITKIDMKPFVAEIANNLQVWFSQNEKDLKNIVDKALNARKAREAARKAREAVRTPKDKKSQLLNLPTKLVDAYSKDRTQCELYIAEGNSAAGGLVDARDPEFQAIFPIRGKIISCLKQSTEKIFANQEVVNIIKATGLELDAKTHKLIFDKKKMRYGKILLAADGDSDGRSIKNLLLTMFWSLCPELVIEGYIYATVPPLYRITTKKNEYVYLTDDNALEEYKTAHAGEKYLVNRNKG